MKPTIVIYEDDAIRRDNFGPHLLLMALAFDVVTDASRADFESRFRPFPKNGADKVVDMLWSDPPTEASETARGAAVVAVLDSDRLTEMVNRRFKCMTRDIESSRGELERRVHERTDRVFVQLVDTNVEWVCQQLLNLEPNLVSPTIARDALKHDRASRDALLRAASRADRGSLREELLKVAPLLKATRDCLVVQFRESQT